MNLTSSPKSREYNTQQAERQYNGAIGAGANQILGDPTPGRPLTASLAELARSMEIAESALAALGSQLTPIMVSYPPAAEGAGGVASTGCEIADFVDRLTERVQRMSNEIHTMRDRLAI